MTSQVHIQLSYWIRDEQKLISYNSSIVVGNSSPLKRVIVNLKKKIAFIISSGGAVLS